jgi:hypothetical protein
MRKLIVRAAHRVSRNRPSLRATNLMATLPDAPYRR